MNEEFYDPIVAEVRQTREKILAEFDGDSEKLSAYLKSKRPEIEAAGFCYETEEETQVRLAWKRQREAELAQKVVNM